MVTERRAAVPEEASAAAEYGIRLRGRPDFGDPINLRVGAAEGNAVHVTYHDGDTEVLADSVAQLIAMLRRLNPR